MAPARVGSVTYANAGSANSLGSGALTNTAGNLLVAVVGTFQSPNAPTVTGVTDTQGNTWQLAAAGIGAVTHGGEIWYALGAVGGSNTITVNLSLTGFVSGIFAEYSGLGAFDVAAAAGDSSAGTSHSSGATAAAGVGDLVLGGYADSTGSPTFTAGSGYSIFGSGITGSINVALEDILGGSAGAQTATITTSTTASGVTVVACFATPAVFSASVPLEHRRGNRPRMFRTIIRRRQVVDALPVATVVLAGESDSLSSATASAAVAVALAGTTAGLTSLTASAGLAVGLAGMSSSLATVAGTTGLAARLTGSATAQASASATAAAAAALVGTSAGISAASGTLQVATALAGVDRSWPPLA